MKRRLSLAVAAALAASVLAAPVASAQAQVICSVTGMPSQNVVVVVGGQPVAVDFDVYPQNAAPYAGAVAAWATDVALCLVDAVAGVTTECAIAILNGRPGGVTADLSNGTVWIDYGDPVGIATCAL
jgi:hypothetical protein